MSHEELPISDDTAIQALRAISDRLRAETGASRTTIRLDCPRLGAKLEIVVAESLARSARSLEGKATPDVRNSAAVRWIAENKRTFVMEDCLNPWAPEVAPEEYVIDLYGIRSEMVSGVFRGDDLVGVVSVHYTAGPRTWSEAEVGMIERACGDVLALVEKVEAVY